MNKQEKINRIKAEARALKHPVFITRTALRWLYGSGWLGSQHLSYRQTMALLREMERDQILASVQTVHNERVWLYLPRVKPAPELSE